MINPAEWHPLSHRYGFASFEDAARWDGMAWRSRHCADNPSAPEAPLFRCLCPGSPSRNQCAIRASQEDRLCDACREHCVAVDDSGRYHRLIDVYGAAR